MSRLLTAAVVLVVGSALTYAIVQRLAALDRAADAPARARTPAPVEVAPLERRSITLTRTFSGALEATAQFVAAPKISGRIRALHVDLGDVVQRGQVVATLDDEELVQAVYGAEAEHAVAVASLAEARRLLVIAERGLQRQQSLLERGIASESEMDTARTAEETRRARVQVSQANLARADATLESRRIRLADGQVTADWTEGDNRRVVASRFVDEGETVSANTPLLTIVEIDPIIAVVFVPERDYARLAIGQRATLETDAHPDERFAGTVERIAPVFRRSTRQARVELLVPNDDQRLRPGMFIRASLSLETVDDALVAPFDAVTNRDGEVGVFVLNDGETTVRWRPVRVGIRDADHIQLHGEGLVGKVVTLGQELCDDGAQVKIIDTSPPATRVTRDASAEPGTP